MQLRFAQNYYWLKCSPLDFTIPLAAGFEFNEVVNLYYTECPFTADVFRQYADDKTRAVLDKHLADLNAELKKSSAVDADVDIPHPPGLDYYPFQKAGIAFALARTNTLFGDEMGLGKTVQAIGFINAVTAVKKALVITPAVVKLNWYRELERWLTRPMHVEIVTSPAKFPEADIIIINYDILGRYRDYIHRPFWDLLICDEAHYLKNPRSQRTCHVVGSNRPKMPAIRARHKLFLTGTPLLNRPIEGWPLFKYLAPSDFPPYYSYAKKYCNAHQGPWGWDMTGASNIPALNNKLRSTIMVRRLKNEVLTELPPKVRQVVELPATALLVKLFQKEQDAWAKRLQIDPGTNYDQFCNAVFQLLEKGMAPFDAISKIRHEQALAKIPAVAQFLIDSLASAPKVVVFAYHRDVIASLAAALGRKKILHSIITGQTPLNARQRYIDRFQTSTDSRVLIANFKAAGVGIDLTAASLVLLAEIDWTPANINQAEDRCHRIGQRTTVLVQYLVSGFMDARMAKMMIEKQEVLDSILNQKE